MPTARGVWPYVAGLVAFALASLLFVWGNHDRPYLRIEATFDSTACCQLEVWVNGYGNLDNHTILPIHQGTTATYKVPLYPSRVSTLFVPVGTQPGGSFVIHRIWVTRGGTTVSSVGLDELRAARTQHLVERNVAGGARYRITGFLAELDLSPAALTAGEGGFRLEVAKVVTDRLTFFPVLLLLAAFLTVVVAARRSTATLLLALLAAIALILNVPWLSHQLDLRDSVAQAVGRSTFVGVWKARERFVLDAAAAVAVIVPLLVLAVAHLSGRRQALPDEPPVEERPLARWVAPALVAAPIAIVGLVGVPDLHALLAGPTTILPTWDANNLAFWQYLVQKTGLEPIRDFFWPYGLQWLFDEAPPWGEVLQYVTYLSFWSYVAIGSYLALARAASGGRLVRRYVLLTAFWLTPVLSGDVPFVTRYVAPIGVLLLFAGIDVNERWLSWRRAVFALAFFELTLFEVAQTFYVLPGLVVVGGCALLIERRGLGRTVVTLAAPLVAATATLALLGALGKTIDFYEATTVASATYASPSAIDSWVKQPFSQAGALLWSSIGLLALGVYALASARGQRRRAGAIVTAFGLLGFLMLQKDVLRPGIESQIWLPVVFGLAFWALTDTVVDAGRRVLAVAAAAGVLAALVLVSGGYHTGWERVSSGPARLDRSVGALVHRHAAFHAVARQEFDAQSLVNYAAYRPVVAALRQNAAVRRGAPVWILGDDSPITMLLGDSWPYYFSDLYDTSPLSFQKLVLRRLAVHPPALVVWNFSPNAVDDQVMAEAVSVPLLFSWAVQHLEPERRVGEREILRPRRRSEPIDLAWWRRRIGSTLDLGHIPEVARETGKACSAGSRGCGTDIVVTVAKGSAAQPALQVPVTVDGLRFVIRIRLSKATRYVVPLDRVWFWAATTGSKSIAAVHVPGVELTQVNRTISDDVLY